VGYVAYEGEWKPRRAPAGDETRAADKRIDVPSEFFVVANEFALVRCRKVYTRNGERLEIEAPKRGLRIHLDAVELESLTWQTPDMLSLLLRSAP
jgi:hypothetical protein